MSDFNIDKSIPIPTDRRKYPFKSMDIGDSFLVIDPRVAISAYSAANRFGIRHGKKFVVRKVEDGQRIWRTE